MVVEHRDGSGPLWCGAFEAASAAAGRRIVVADPGETSDDLVRDMIEVLASVCGRRYGRGGARSRAMRALSAAKCGLGRGA
jgi:putative resolvase